VVSTNATDWSDGCNYANSEISAQVLEFRRKQVVVRDLAPQKRWLIAYTAINLGGADVKIRGADRAGLRSPSEKRSDL
jgi:hypothetical protein